MNNEKKQGCGCGGHGHEEHDHEEAQVIYLTLDDEEEIACKVLTIFEVEGNEYISLLPENSEDVYIYKYKETEEVPELEQIESDDEFNKVSQAFYDLCD